MNRFWLDASAIAKRYVPETGSPLMNHLFSQIPATSLVCLLEGVGEVISILVRGRNRGTLPAVTFQQAMSRLDIEVIHNDDFEKYHPGSIEVAPSWKLIEKHSINSTDSIILKCALDRAAEIRTDGHDLVLVSADSRLVRAAKAEGLFTFNPETDSQSDLDALII